MESLTIKCLEALKWTYEVTGFEKLQAAIKTNAPNLADHAIESLSAEDIKELVESDLMKELGEERLAKILKKSASFL
ncbi:hypothetical protein AAVH_21059 [Aphelenchoides avenae]|nr:hypothetical protein AAVH_21059 [Aphelenchus avenae]